jgi:hypothetical protein
MAILAVTVGYILFRRMPGTEARELPHAEPSLTSVVVPVAAFPGVVNWGAVGQLADLLPSPPGWEIRYTATQVLASRGHPETPLETLREMLDENQQGRNYPVLLQDGKLVVNEAGVQEVILVGLKSVREWHKHPNAVAAHKGDPQLAKILAAVEKLTESSNTVISGEARNVQKAIAGKS